MVSTKTLKSKTVEINKDPVVTCIFSSGCKKRMVTNRFLNLHFTEKNPYRRNDEIYEYELCGYVRTNIYRYTSLGLWCTSSFFGSTRVGRVSETVLCFIYSRREKLGVRSESILDLWWLTRYNYGVLYLMRGSG